MKLIQAHLETFDRKGGYLSLPSLFSPAEIAMLNREVPRIYAERRPEVVRGKDGATPRTSFAARTYNAAFAKLSRHPRLVRPVEQLLGEKRYMQQFKINAQAVFDGDHRAPKGRPAPSSCSPRAWCTPRAAT